MLIEDAGPEFRIPPVPVNPMNAFRIAMNTFTYDSRIHWDQLRNYSHARTGGGSSESAYELKKAVASQSATAH